MAERKKYGSSPNQSPRGCCLGFLLRIVLLIIIVAALVFKLSGGALPGGLLPSQITKVFGGVAEDIVDMWKTVFPGEESADAESTEETSAGSDASQETSADKTASGSDTSDSEPSGVDDSVIEAASHAGQADCYYYSILDAEDRKTYCQIYQGISRAEESFTVSADYDQVEDLMDMVSSDHPEIFWYEGTYSSRQRLLGGAEIRPTYNCSGEEMIRKAEEIEKAGQSVLADIPDPEEDPEAAALAVYDYLISEITYDENASDNQNLYSSLVNHTTVCAGYARAAEYLLQNLGIESVYLYGYTTEGDSHAWNALELDGHWYLLDATCGRSFIETDIGSKVSDAAYAYFCCTDQELYRGRKAELADRIPVCDSEDLEYYDKKEMRLDACDETQLRKTIYNALKEGDGWSVQFTNEAAYKECLQLLDQGMMTDVIRDNSLRSGNMLYQVQYDDILYTITCLITPQ